MNHAKSAWTTGFVLMLFVGPNVFGQAPPSAACSNMPADFLELADLRGQLKIDIANLEQSIKELPGKIEQAKSAENELRETEQQLKKLQDKANKTPADDQQIDSLEKLRASIQKLLGGNSSGSYQADLDQKRSDLKEKAQLLRCTEKAIAGFFSPEQSFKTWMSFAFAFLILVVIAGFFVLSYKDPRIRQAIFSGQAGMQFLTLFSLVIAIILFGITNILHDKELAALLGGLSGYILGRANVPSAQAGNVPPIQPQGGIGASAGGGAGAAGAEMPEPENREG